MPMSSQETSTTEELVQLARRASEARGLNALVCAQYELRAALRRAVVARQWSQLGEAQRGVAGSPDVASRFDESLRSVLEAPELGAREGSARWYGLVLAIPVTLTSRSGTLLSLPSGLAHAFRDSLQERFPPGTGIRLINRPVPQLAAHALSVQALYELTGELAAGAGGADEIPGTQAEGAFVPDGRSLGQHYFFALALTTRPEQLALDLPDLQAEPRLAKWAAEQTERISSDFAERGWPFLMRVSPPRRLREMLASSPVLGDVRELDAFLEHTAARVGAPVTALRAELALARSGEVGVRIALSDGAGTPAAHALYRINSLGAEAGTYRVAVRLASAGVALKASDEILEGAVQRAIMLTNVPVPSDPGQPETATPHPLALTTLRSRFARPTRHSS